MSHELLDEQREEAQNQLGVTEIKILPNELLKIWRSIDPIGELPIEELYKIVQWIDMESSLNDYILIQGEYGGTFYLVDYCLKNGRIPIYATTNRVVEEKREGDHIVTKRIFKHGCLRRYIGFT
jgi:hypothetical protein